MLVICLDAFVEVDVRNSDARRCSMVKFVHFFIGFYFISVSIFDDNDDKGVDLSIGGNDKSMGRKSLIEKSRRKL